MSPYVSFTIHHLHFMIFPLTRGLMGVWIRVSCVMCSFMSELHNLIYTCQDMKPSLTHCLLVMIHMATKVSMLTATMAKMNANSEYDMH